MVINTNLAAANGQRLLADSTDRLNESLSRLASGSKLINPQDDAAGLAVATKFDAAISWGDKMFDHYKRSIESAFQTKVFENYHSLSSTIIHYHPVLPRV